MVFILSRDDAFLIQFQLPESREVDKSTEKWKK
jgi:hypothetical protein